MIVNSDSPDQWTVSGPGAQRRILCQQKELMMIEFRFEKGGEGLLHSHPHIQTTYIQSGRFEFTIAGVTKILEPGDATMMPANAVHGCVCLEAGVLIDAFTPRRDDFMEAHGWPLD
jgi:quercetin dioxygenase-like cupin family protein